MRQLFYYKGRWRLLPGYYLGYYKVRQVLLQSATKCDKVRQRATGYFIIKCDKFYYKVRRLFYYKVRQLFYYKVRQVLLQSATAILLQSATAILLQSATVILL